jgi:hypothetical protein
MIATAATAAVDRARPPTAPAGTMNTIPTRPAETTVSASAKIDTATDVMTVDGTGARGGIEGMTATVATRAGTETSSTIVEDAAVVTGGIGMGLEAVVVGNAGIAATRPRPGRRNRLRISPTSSRFWIGSAV